MKTNSLRRLNGLSSIVTGALFITGHALDFGGSGGMGTVLGDTFVLMAHLSAVFAFFGLYEAQGSKRGLLGLIGMVAGIVGTIFVTAIVYVELAGASGAQVDAVFAQQVPGMIQAFGPLLFVIGMILFGLADIRHRGALRSGGILLIAGTVIFAIGSFSGSAQLTVEVIGSAFTAGGFIRMGLPLVNGKINVHPIRKPISLPSE
ncbi:hypothetical protein [Paenibacillus beijingensis]|uniref:Uncharacterized protein n=1 Tax=Paenibacillus beijingensis TaxID=1126833 RepID=A0A0D5NME7_9BACL|nr:hypothetical protein [Paenibacillus beijingensis]AJY76504.1 hypothetical protein VN24_20460 [Paenibacillus beijingensis]